MNIKREPIPVNFIGIVLWKFGFSVGALESIKLFLIPKLHSIACPPISTSLDGLLCKGLANAARELELWTHPSCVVILEGAELSGCWIHVSSSVLYIVKLLTYFRCADCSRSHLRCVLMFSNAVF